MPMTATAAAEAKVTATATMTMMTKLSQSYRVWQVSAIGSKGSGNRLFIFKYSNHVGNEGSDRSIDRDCSSDSDSDSNRNNHDNDISVI